MSPPTKSSPCETVVDALERFIDRETSESESLAIEQHVESCAFCARELALAQEIRAELRALPSMDAPTTVVEAVKRTAQDERQEVSKSRWTSLRPSPVWALAAALILAAVLTPVLWSPPTEEVATVGAAPDGYGEEEVDPAEIERATEEVRMALAYVGRATRRTGFEIRDSLILERLVRPAAESLSTLRDAPGGDVGRERNET